MSSQPFTFTLDPDVRSVVERELPNIWPSRKDGFRTSPPPALFEFSLVPESMERLSEPPVPSGSSGVPKIKPERSEQPEQRGQSEQLENPNTSDVPKSTPRDGVKRADSKDVKEIKKEAEPDSTVSSSVSEHRSHGRIEINLTGDDDSDDDIMIIEESDLSEAAKDRLKQWKPSKPSNDGRSSVRLRYQPVVKAEQVEAGFQNAELENLEQVQQVEGIEEVEIIEQVQQVEQVDENKESEDSRMADGGRLFVTPDPDADFEGDEYEALSDGSERTQSPRRKGAGKPRKTAKDDPSVPAQEDLTLEGKDSDADGGMSEAETDRTLRNLRAKIEICKLERGIIESEKDRPGFSSQPKLDEFEAKIDELHGEIKKVEKERKIRQRNKPAPDAREYWRRRYGKQPQFIKRLNKKRTADLATSAGKARKRQKVGPGGMVESDEGIPEDDIKAMKNIDPIKALAEMGEIPMPGAMVANAKETKTRFMEQLKSFKKLNPEDGDFKNDHKALEEATKSFGFRKCLLDKDTKSKGKRVKAARWKLAGLKTSLYSHQVVGASFMAGRELSPFGPFGGMMCDEMGLFPWLKIYS